MPKRSTLHLKSLARRVMDLNDEIAELDRFIVPLVQELAPSLLDLEGVGTENAGAMMVAVGENPERLRSEVSFATMRGVCPIPASRAGKLNVTASIAAGTAKPTPPCTWSSCAGCVPTNEPEPMWPARSTASGPARRPSVTAPLPRDRQARGSERQQVSLVDRLVLDRPFKPVAGVEFAHRPALPVFP